MSSVVSVAVDDVVATGPLTCRAELTWSVRALQRVVKAAKPRQRVSSRPVPLELPSAPIAAKKKKTKQNENENENDKDSAKAADDPTEMVRGCLLASRWRFLFFPKWPNVASSSRAASPTNQHDDQVLNSTAATEEFKPAFGVECLPFDDENQTPSSSSSSSKKPCEIESFNCTLSLASSASSSPCAENNNDKNDNANDSGGDHNNDKQATMMMQLLEILENDDDDDDDEQEQQNPKQDGDESKKDPNTEKTKTENNNDANRVAHTTHLLTAPNALQDIGDKLILRVVLVVTLRHRCAGGIAARRAFAAEEAERIQHTQRIGLTAVGAPTTEMVSELAHEGGQLLGGVFSSIGATMTEKLRRTQQQQQDGHADNENEKEDETKHENNDNTKPTTTPNANETTHPNNDETTEQKESSQENRNDEENAHKTTRENHDDETVQTSSSLPSQEQHTSNKMKKDKEESHETTPQKRSTPKHRLSITKTTKTTTPDDTASSTTTVLSEADRARHAAFWAARFAPLALESNAEFPINWQNDMRVAWCALCHELAAADIFFTDAEWRLPRPQADDETAAARFEAFFGASFDQLAMYCGSQNKNTKSSSSSAATHEVSSFAAASSASMIHLTHESLLASPRVRAHVPPSVDDNLARRAVNAFSRLASLRRTSTEKSNELSQKHKATSDSNASSPSSSSSIAVFFWLRFLYVLDTLTAAKNASDVETILNSMIKNSHGKTPAASDTSGFATSNNIALAVGMEMNAHVDAIRVAPHDADMHIELLSTCLRASFQHSSTLSATGAFEDTDNEDEDEDGNEHKRQNEDASSHWSNAEKRARHNSKNASTRSLSWLPSVVVPASARKQRRLCLEQQETNNTSSSAFRTMNQDQIEQTQVRIDELAHTIEQVREVHRTWANEADAERKRNAARTARRDHLLSSPIHGRLMAALLTARGERTTKSSTATTTAATPTTASTTTSTLDALSQHASPLRNDFAGDAHTIMSTTTNTTNQLALQMCNSAEAVLKTLSDLLLVEEESLSVLESKTKTKTKCEDKEQKDLTWFDFVVFGKRDEREETKETTTTNNDNIIKEKTEKTAMADEHHVNEEGSSLSSHQQTPTAVPLTKQPRRQGKKSD